MGFAKGLKQIAVEFINLIGKDKAPKGSRRETRAAQEVHSTRARSARESAAPCTSGFSSPPPHSSLPHLPGLPSDFAIYRDALSDDGVRVPNRAQSLKQVAASSHGKACATGLSSSCKLFTTGLAPRCTVQSGPATGGVQPSARCTASSSGPAPSVAPGNNGNGLELPYAKTAPLIVSAAAPKATSQKLEAAGPESEPEDFRLDLRRVVDPTAKSSRTQQNHPDGSVPFTVGINVTSNYDAASSTAAVAAAASAGVSNGNTIPATAPVPQHPATVPAAVTPPPPPAPSPTSGLQLVVASPAHISIERSQGVGTAAPAGPLPPRTCGSAATAPDRAAAPVAIFRSPSSATASVGRPTPAAGQLYLSPSLPAEMTWRGPSRWSMQDFEVGRRIHKGYSSNVFKATCRTSGSDVVLKAYNLAGLSTFLRNQVLRELDVHSRLRHPIVVHLMAAFREDDNLVMVQEYVRGGSLDRVRRKLGGRMTEFQAMHLVLLPLLGVLSYLHDRGIVHRDIKPDNLLFTDNWKLKLCDFGVSICLREERAVTRTGTREYLAPEVDRCPPKRMPEDNKDNLALVYGSSVDVWSLGALMYELLVGFTPFPGGPPARRGDGDHGSAGAGLAFPSSVSPSARAFVRDCLHLDPADRPTVHQLLEHSWIQEALIAAEALIADK